MQWIPEWGRERMTGMFATRPDWCISRQRVWGVPIPALACQGCGTSWLTREILEQAAKVFEAQSADAWYELATDAFVPAGFKCSKCGGAAFERERDILDVWFDSGSSHQAVLEKRPELAWPADLYLEGTDQHRGWFQSSLLVGIGTRNHAPYKSVLTHGFVVDEHGHKMSKSLGNDVPPQRVIQDSGADVCACGCRWSITRRDPARQGSVVATVEPIERSATRSDTCCRTSMTSIRRRTRSLTDMLAVDRYALSAFARLAGDVRRVRRSNFQAIFHAINEFATVDLSAFYLDVSKDRRTSLALLASGVRLKRP